jgi:hypothetical protein
MDFFGPCGAGADAGRPCRLQQLRAPATLTGVGEPGAAGRQCVSSRFPSVLRVTASSDAPSAQLERSFASFEYGNAGRVDSASLANSAFIVIGERSKPGETVPLSIR